MNKGRYVTRFADAGADIRSAQVLRFRAFIDQKATADQLDQDIFDDRCLHLLVEERHSSRLVATVRLLPLSGGEGIDKSYSAQFYELSGLRGYDAPMVEMGRFCVDPSCHDPEILRVAWAAITRFVDETEVEMLFGCSSFDGINAKAYEESFALLKERHLGPKQFQPKIKAPNVFRFAQRLRRDPDAKRAMKSMPPLLRSYLRMGGWVGDHAVVDRDLNTLHVFTGLEIRSIPPRRKQLMRMAAG
ncbi:MAG: GNAT family N-acyltransferase [Pseudoruegeria sp.]